MQQNNLTTTMQNFGKLTAEERALFLSVISAEKVEEKKTQKRKKSSLPFEYTKEYYEQYLKHVHNIEVKARLERISAKQRNQTTGISQGLTH